MFIPTFLLLYVIWQYIEALANCLSWEAWVIHELLRSYSEYQVDSRVVFLLFCCVHLCSYFWWRAVEIFNVLCSRFVCLWYWIVLSVRTLLSSAALVERKDQYWNDGPVPAGFTITFLIYNFVVCVSVAVVTVAILLTAATYSGVN